MDFRVEQQIAVLLTGFPNGRHLRWPLLKLSELAEVTGLCLGIRVKKQSLPECMITWVQGERVANDFNVSPRLQSSKQAN